MTKEALRTQYVDAGWQVQPVASWLKVSEIEGKVKYDVNVVSPEDTFGTAQVIVTDDGKAGEDAVAAGFWKEKEANFSEEVRAFLDTKEAGQVFAIAITETYEADQVVECKAYMTDNTEANYVVKKRGGTISFQQTT